MTQDALRAALEAVSATDVALVMESDGESRPHRVDRPGPFVKRDMLAAFDAALASPDTGVAEGAGNETHLSPGHIEDQRRGIPSREEVEDMPDE